MNASIKNRIIALHARVKSIEHAKRYRLRDNMVFAMDMEERVCRGSKNDYQQLEKYSQGSMDLFFVLFKILTRGNCKLFLHIVSGTKKL